MNTDFEARLGRELLDYAAVAGGPASEAEVAQAFAARRNAQRLRPWSLGPVDRRVLLVAAALALATLIGAVLALGSLPKEPLPELPGAALSIVAGGVDQGIWEWDAQGHEWLDVNGNQLRGLSPDGRWISWVTCCSAGQLFIRPVGGTMRSFQPVWGGADTADSGYRTPAGTWSRNARGLLAVLPDGDLRVADINASPIAVSSYAGFPEALGSLVWGYFGDAGARVVALGASGTVYRLDLPRGSAIETATITALAGNPDVEETPQIALSRDDASVAAIGHDGIVYVIHLPEGNVREVAADPALAGASIWGFSADGLWVGAGDRMVKVLTAEQVRLSGADGPGCASVPTWGPAGHAVAWVADAALYIRDDHGVVVRHDVECPNGSAPSRVPIAWRPDGGALALSIRRSDASGWPTGGTVWVYDLGSGSMTLAASDDQTGRNYDVGWRAVP